MAGWHRCSFVQVSRHSSGTAVAPTGRGKRTGNGGDGVRIVPDADRPFDRPAKVPAGCSSGTSVWINELSAAWRALTTQPLA